MRWLLMPAAAAALLASCGPANGNRTGDKAERGPETGLAGGADTSTTARGPGDTASAGGGGATSDAAVLSQLDLANTAEIQEAQSAMRKTRNPAVKEFAQKLVTDHRQNREQARALGKRLGETTTPTSGQTSEEQSAAQGELAGKTGADFDRAFIEHQVRVHEENIDQIEKQLLPSVHDPQVKAFLQKTVETTRGHLASATQLKQDLGTTPGAT